MTTTTVVATVAFVAAVATLVTFQLWADRFIAQTEE